MPRFDSTQILKALGDGEARFRTLVDSMPECVKVVGPDGELLFMNRAGLGMIECDSEKEPQIIGTSVFDVVAREHRPDWRVRHRRVCQGESMSWEFEIVGLRGTRRWMETHATPLQLADGRRAQFAFTREITQRKQAELERESLLDAERAARNSAERASALKDEFLATLSHELRTPLNAILGWTQLLRADPEASTKVRHGLEIIERNVRAQAQIIEDLLDMSAIMAGKVRLDVQALDLSGIVHAAIESVRPAAMAKDIRLVQVIDAHAGRVLGDPNRLQQVLWNLLSNAIKFSNKGGRVQIALERVNSHVELTVADDGAGIEPEFLPHVFDRFRQADASTTRKHGGLGLGLAICKQLIELHGGTIRAKSGGAGQGSTFAIQLPVRALVNPAGYAHRAEQAEISVGEADLARLDVRLDGLHVLVVDDEADTRTMLCQLLERYGAEVECLGSAAEGMEALAQRAFSVIVSDVGMPDVDGYTFMQQLRSMASPNRNTPAIALTAYARAEDRIRAMRAGFQLHLSKPVQPAELVTTIASVTGRWIDPEAG